MDSLYEYMKMSGKSRGEKNSLLNVFELLKNQSQKYLLVREDYPICHYSTILEWREFCKVIGEDIAVCAFLAKRTQLTNHIWRDFEWGVVIGHDNVQLNRIMERGISDNHFHLFGSAPSFQLIWIRLMNHINNREYLACLDEIDKNRRINRNAYSNSYQEDSLKYMVIKAALIRAVLYNFLSISEVVDFELDRDEQSRISFIDNLLDDSIDIFFYVEQIQLFIDSLQEMGDINDRKGREIDYALRKHDCRSINHEFEGERSFLYDMFCRGGNEEDIPAVMLQWFYGYLVIQTKIREELVQVNDNIGFENFSIYNSRKAGFLNTEDDTCAMVQHAICGSMETGNFNALEVRISPCNSAEENVEWINICDGYISGKCREEVWERIYYVLHFPKKSDDGNGVYRHENYRLELERKAQELIRMREDYPQTASRILGIDGCAQEIGCRPEVFGPIFRLLKDHVNNYYPSFGLKQWKITYHVGEDWLDVADGMRAIDEALRFFSLENGDRLGHATILGIDIGKWYSKKKRLIYLPLQDYIDNVVWMYYKIIEFDIRDCETLKGELRREFSNEIFRLYPVEDVSKIDISVYYEAWKLRGDDPRGYQEYVNENEIKIFFPYWIEEDYIHSTEVCRDILKQYHFDKEIRRKGKEIVRKKVSDHYICGLIQIQGAMREMVSKKGISIETNPSSNYVISTMDNYDEHPILKMFNVGLPSNHQECGEYEQLHVSINTDDKGLFMTSLENEFALMACAVENMKNDEGKYIYQKQNVYDWLDRIRQNGNEQSFLKREESIYNDLRM